MSQFFPARTPCLHRMTSGEKNPLMQGYSHALEVSMALQKDPAQVGGPDSLYQGIRVLLLMEVPVFQVILIAG